MAEPQNSTSIVPVNGEYQLEIKDFSPSGAISKFGIAIPNNLTSQEASIMLRAAVLKNTSWKDKPFPVVLHAVMYADRMGLDIMVGDVYTPDGGRLSTTAGAKIRHAMNSDRIEGYEVKIEELDRPLSIPWEAGKESGVYTGKELKAVVTVNVKGFKAPVVYEAYLSEWFSGKNPNWRNRPAYMLRRNALSKALEEVAPMGAEADEVPPLEPTKQ